MEIIIIFSLDTKYQLSTEDTDGKEIKNVVAEDRNGNFISALTSSSPSTT